MELESKAKKNMYKLISSDVNNMIEMFEQRWNQWSVNDLVSWFKYILTKMQNENVIDEKLCEMKDNEHQMDNNNSSNTKEPNWDKITKNLDTLAFQPENVLPNMGFGLLKYFGFENDIICEYLAEQITQLVTNYST